MRPYPVAASCTCAIVLGFVLSGCASSQSPQEEVVATPQPASVTVEPAAVTVPTEIVTVHPALITAWQGKDPTALQLYFTPDAVVITPDEQFTGWSDIQTRWITPVLPGMSNFVATPTEFTRQGADIIETGKYSFSLTKDGATETQSGTYTQKWVRQSDGSWRLASVNVQ